MFVKSNKNSRPLKVKKSKKPVRLSRKEERKKARKEKKQQKNEHFAQRGKLKKTKNQKVKQTKTPHDSDESIHSDSETETPVETTPMSVEINKEKKEKLKLDKEMRKQRKKQLMMANEEEDKNIRILEKQLKINKRKTKNAPKSFTASGLDYILDVCDSEKIQTAVNAEMNLQDSGSEFEEDLALITGKDEKLKKKTKKLKMDNSDIGESDDDFGLGEETDEYSDQDIGDETILSSEGEDMEKSTPESDVEDMEEPESGDEIDEEIDSNEENTEDNKTNENLDTKKETWEDIYGRVRDKQGNVINDSSTKYIPPHLREKPDDKRKEELERLKKQLKGLLNRLAENNMHNISNQIDELYMKNSRSDMNGMILNLYLDSLVSHVLTPERLVMEHAMLLAILHGNVGSEVGAYFLQHLGKQFCDMHKEKQTIENKELDNLILLICHMYTFKMFDSLLIYDILNLLCEKFTPKDVDLILAILRSVGFSLRKSDPIALKNFILKVQKLAGEANEMKEDSRVRFMLDVLLAIKNNNMAKLPQYDPTHSEHLKKLIKTMIRKGNYIYELKISLDDLLKAEERGRWWVVGSAWSGPAPQAEKSKQKQQSTFSQEVLELARKQRMNTANRKNIFCILMTAEDYLDAFEKLLKLGLKGQQEQEIIHVLVHCLLRENNYNPYYSYIADQLCMSDRRHKMTLQYAIWDRLKEMKSLQKNQIVNMAKFLAHLFLEKSLPLSILKVLEFTEMDKFCVRLLRQTLLTLLLHDDQEAVLEVFTKIAKPLKLHMFRESLRLFIHHFLLKNMKNIDTDEAIKLKQRIALVDKSFTAFSDSKF